jgi:thioredoxin-like negative regulator of GroEL
VSGDPNLQTIVVAGLLRCAVALDNRNDAQELYEYVRGATSSSGGAAAAVENTKRKALPPQRAHIDKRIVGALEAFELYDLRNKLDRANDDAMHQQFATALDQWSLGHVDECLKLLLDLVRKDKKWREELAKQTFVKVCNILQVIVNSGSLFFVVELSCLG